MKRMFLAIPFSEQEKLDLKHWRDQAAWPFKPVQAANFHLTLVFLGQVSQTQEDEIIARCATIKNAPFDIRLRDLDCWTKPKVIVLNAANTPQQLSSLVNSLTNICESAGFRLENRRYRPHVTLYRKANHLPEQRLFDVSYSVKRFSLFHSKSTENGVMYDEICSWPLAI